MREELNTTRDHVDNFISDVVGWLPEIIGALLILVIGYFVAKGLQAATRTLLNKARLNDHVRSAAGGSVIQRAVPNPVGFVSKLVFWIVFLFVISIAVSVLGIPALVNIVEGIYSYIPNIIAAVLIFLVASAISAGVVTLATNTLGDTPTGRVAATAAPIVIMGLAVFMILNQLNIAPEIVTITYAALVGSAALGMALAFGLGGRDVAREILQNMYTKSKDVAPQVRADAQVAKNRAKNKLR